MKTYGHLRREHSIAQAQKVSFTPIAADQRHVIAFPVPEIETLKELEL